VAGGKRKNWKTRKVIRQTKKKVRGTHENIKVAKQTRKGRNQEGGRGRGAKKLAQRNQEIRRGIGLIVKRPKHFSKKRDRRRREAAGERKRRGGGAKNAENYRRIVSKTG